MSIFRPLARALVILGLSLPLFGQCPMGTVKIRGHVSNLKGNEVPAEVSVKVQTPKGTDSRTSPVVADEFSLEIPFGTQSAPYFPLWGHRCNNLPKFIEIDVIKATRTVGHVRLPFKEYFEPEIPGRDIYRLKRELTINSSD